VEATGLSSRGGLLAGPTRLLAEPALAGTTRLLAEPALAGTTRLPAEPASLQSETNNYLDFGVESALVLAGVFFAAGFAVDLWCFLVLVVELALVLGALGAGVLGV
jgi:hypothetical protein